MIPKLESADFSWMGISQTDPAPRAWPSTGDFRGAPFGSTEYHENPDTEEI